MGIVPASATEEGHWGTGEGTGWRGGGGEWSGFFMYRCGKGEKLSGEGGGLPRDPGGPGGPGIGEWEGGVHGRRRLPVGRGEEDLDTRVGLGSLATTAESVRGDRRQSSGNWELGIG